MAHAISHYINTLCERFGAGWNRFWYTPSDPYALGVIRIATGLLALYFASSYSQDLVRLFGADGMLPVETMTELRGDARGGFSYFNYLHTPAQLYAAHIAGIVAIALFTAGLFTRVTSVLALVAVLSYIQRAPVLTGLFEPILAMVMFYLCLGPAGAGLSLDGLRRKNATDDPPLRYGATIVVRLIQVHLSVAYLMMAVGKIAEPGNAWWVGEAVWWLMARPESRVIDVTGTFHNHPYLINAWSHAIVLFEFSFALLIWNRLARPLLLVLAIPMWISLALISGQTAFCAMMLVANLAFVDPAQLRALFGHAPQAPRS